jgi:hypothetical protein
MGMDLEQASRKDTIDQVRVLAEEALRERLRTLTGDSLDRAGRLARLEDAFVPTVSTDARRLAVLDVREGDGGELEQPPDSTLSPRFHSARSSCALAVNAFGLWRCEPGPLVVEGVSGFEEVRFERKFPIERADPRYPPNVDVYATAPNGGVAIESKLLEYIAVAEPASFAPKYDFAIEAHAHASWREQIDRLRKSPNEFSFFGAAQIVKHYLGLKSAGVPGGHLIYLYWEPLDHAQHRLFAQHRDEVESFAAGLADPSISFRGLAYATLFAEWERLERPELTEHVRALRERYDVSLFEDA